MQMMASAFGPLFLALVITSAHALKLPVQRRMSHGAVLTSLANPTRYSFSASKSETTEVGDFASLRYSTNITINGVEVPVALDTGSTDLWVIPPGGIGQFNDTGIPIELLYGDGSSGTKGTIGVSPFQLGSYVVENQAFMNAVESNIALVQDAGIYGIMGLSFDFSSASPINQNIKAIYGEDATWGRSVLRNIFQEHPTEPNFIAIDLTRTDDMEDTSGGSFTIGEYVDEYATVASKPQLPQWPTGGDRWTVLLEGIYVDSAAIEVQSAIPGVPYGQAQALLDTGDLSSIFPVAIADAIYSRIPGSVLYTADGTTHLWIIPCNTTTSVEFSFGGERYPVHPLDLSTFSDPISVSGQDYIACVASFKAADGWGAGGFDISLGDTFLRNVYPVFDFGSPLPDGSTGDPFIQLLSKIDPVKAVGEVATIRGRTMGSMPPEIDPVVLINLLSGGAPSDSASETVVDATPTQTDSSPGPDSTTDGAADLFESSPLGSTSTSLSPSNSDIKVLATDNAHVVTVDEPLVKKYGLIIIGLLFVNAIIGIILIVLGVLACFGRGSRRTAARRDGPPVYAPVKGLDHHDDELSEDYPKSYSQ